MKYCRHPEWERERLSVWAYKASQSSERGWVRLGKAQSERRKEGLTQERAPPQGLARDPEGKPIPRWRHRDEWGGGPRDRGPQMAWLWILDLTKRVILWPFIPHHLPSGLGYFKMTVDSLW